MDATDYKVLFDQSSSLTVVMDTGFTIVAASDAFLKATKTVRENIVGQGLFDVFPDNPADETANGKSKVLDSFNWVLKNKRPDKLPVVKYDIPKPESQGGGFEVKYWQAIHSPVLDEENNVKYIIQRAEDVTENKTLNTQLEFEKKALKLVEASEKRYNMMLMKSPFGFAVFKGKNMVITLANDSIKTFWGKGNDLEGKPLFDVLPELKDSAFKGLLDQVYATGTPFYGDEVLASVLRNGKLEDAYYSFVYQPYLEADETISGVTVIAYDVTKMVLAHKKIEESEIHFRQLADLMPAKISNANAAGDVTYFNKHWLEYSGYTFEELRDFGYHKIMHPDELDEFEKRLLIAGETGTVLEMEMRFMNKEGDYRWHLNLASPIKDENGNIKMWVGSTTLIHQQKEQEAGLEKAVNERTAELEKANKELAYQIEEKEKQTQYLIAANKELESFTYVSSHDLQEPLRQIQVFSDLILDEERENLTDKGKGYFARMRSTGLRMQTLIKDLLVYSRTNVTERKFEHTDLSKIIKDVQAELQETITQKHAIIEVTALCRADIIVFQFRQLMYNLIGNALKFSKPGHPPHIIITSRIVEGSKSNNENLLPEKNYCHITITDNGIGFEPQFKDKIFEVFQRLHGQEEYQGTGIGLAIVKKIVENHHGIITASSQLNEGATFDIYIPAT